VGRGSSLPLLLPSILGGGSRISLSLLYLLLVFPPCLLTLKSPASCGHSVQSLCGKLILLHFLEHSSYQRSLESWDDTVDRVLGKQQQKASIVQSDTFKFLGLNSFDCNLSLFESFTFTQAQACTHITHQHHHHQ
jgi:hypothetical protein